MCAPDHSEVPRYTLVERVRGVIVGSRCVGVETVKVGARSKVHSVCMNDSNECVNWVSYAIRLGAPKPVALTHVNSLAGLDDEAVAAETQPRYKTGDHRLRQRGSISATRSNTSTSGLVHFCPLWTHIINNHQKGTHVVTLRGMQCNDFVHLDSRFPDICQWYSSDPTALAGRAVISFE